MLSSKYKLKKNSFYVFLLIPIFFIYSYLLISPYTEGDQFYYRAFYDALADTKFNNVLPLALKKVASIEPVSIYVLWLGSTLGINKDIFISILNVLLLVGLFLLCRKNKVGILPLFLLITNFYIIVLMTGAERLKIAYIILIWASFYSDVRGRLLLGISGLSHLQNFLMFPSLILAYYSESIRRLFMAAKLNKQFIKVIIIMVFFSLILFSLYNETISRKVIGAISRIDSSTIQILNLLILSIVAIFATKNYWRMIMLLIPMYPAVSLLGGERVNMIAVTLVIYILIKERALNHPFVLLLLGYFSLKSISFINNILKYGSGFV